MQSEALRDTLFAVATTGDRPRLKALCREHRDRIREHFAAWKEPPDDARASEEHGRRHVEGLVEVARCFAAELGDESLMRAFLEGPADRPIDRWQLALAEVEDLWGEGAHARAAELLEEVLADPPSPDDDQASLAALHGRLGESYFHAGEPERALAPAARALELASARGDTAAVLASLGTLHEVHRYLGDTERAAERADQLAEALDAAGRAVEAVAARKRAALVRAGEPPVRVVAHVDGEVIELDELTSVPDGQVELGFVRNRVALEAARAEVESGLALSEAGDLTAALAAFDRAAERDPHAPEPHIERAFVLLQLERHAEAQAAHLRVEELAPGWLNSRSGAWLAGELAAGRVPSAAFPALTALENGPQPAADKVELAEAMIASGLDFPLIRLYLGDCLAALGQAADARAQHEAGLELGGEPDVRTRLLTRLGTPTPTHPGRREYLEEAVALGGCLVAAARARVALLLFEE